MGEFAGCQSTAFGEWCMRWKTKTKKKENTLVNRTASQDINMDTDRP